LDIKNIKNPKTFWVFNYIKSRKKCKNMKTLKISKELHSEIKSFCVDNGLKMNQWVEKQLALKLKELLNDKREA